MCGPSIFINSLVMTKAIKRNNIHDLGADYFYDVLNRRKICVSIFDHYLIHVCKDMRNNFANRYGLSTTLRQHQRHNDMLSYNY